MARTVGSDGKKTRERILSAVTPLFANLGYAAVSMRMIAEEVGVHPSALYNHFPNKQSILLAVIEDPVDEILKGTQALDLHRLAPADQLQAFCRHHIQFYTARPEEIFISYMELRSLTPENFKVIEAKRRAYDTILRKIIDAGVACGDFKVDDTHVAAMSILGSLAGINTWFRPSGRLSKSRIEAYYSNISLRTVGYQKVPSYV